MKKTAKKPSGTLVYSTEIGRTCPVCSQAIAECVCHTNTLMPATDGVVRVSLETKGRRGKGVTVIRGVPLDALALATLGKQLKAACGTGGTTKQGIIEIQGDQRQLVIDMLKPHGWVIKRAGG